MQTFTISLDRGTLDVPAARAHLASELADCMNSDIVGVGPEDEYAGVWAFVTRIDQLFSGAAGRLAGHVQTGERTWLVSYPEGEGDPHGGDTDWVANAEWFDSLLPRLLPILGVRVVVGPSSYGEPGCVLPRAR